MGVFINKENYLMELCIAHPQVAHNSIVNGKPRNSFFRSNNDEEILAATLNNINYPCVGYSALEGRITDTDSALVDIRHSFKNSWIFLMHLDWITPKTGGGYTDKIQSCYDTAFTIMEDFIRAMKIDFEENGHCGAFENFDLNKINYVQVGPILQNEYGWILYFDDEIEAFNITGGDDYSTGGGGSNTGIRSPNVEIIEVNNQNSKAVDWTPVRLAKFGGFPVVEVWLIDHDGTWYLAAVQPTINAAPPDFTLMSFDFGKNVTGIIVLK